MEDVDRSARPAVTYRLPGGVTYSSRSSTSSAGWLEVEGGLRHFPLAYGREDVLRTLLTKGAEAIPALRASDGETLAQVLQAVGDEYDWDRARDAYLSRLDRRPTESEASLAGNTETAKGTARPAVTESTKTTTGSARRSSVTDYLKSTVRWAIDRVDGDVFDDVFFREIVDFRSDDETIAWMRENLEKSHPGLSFVEPTAALADDDWDDDSKLAFTTWTVQRRLNPRLDTAYVFSFEHEPTQLLWTVSSELDTEASELLRSLAASLDEQGRRIESGTTPNTLRQALKSTTGYDPEIGL